MYIYLKKIYLLILFNKCLCCYSDQSSRIDTAIWMHYLDAN